MDVLSRYAMQTGALWAITDIAGDDIIRWVDYATKHPKDVGYAFTQLMLVADTLKNAKAHAEQRADLQLAKDAA